MISILKFTKFGLIGKRCASTFDLAVIGSGPGGYVAAIKAAQLGLKTACIEKYENLGGTCLNVGCIPSKSLLHNSHLYYLARTGDLAKRGIVQTGAADGFKVDLKAMMAQKAAAVSGLTSGVNILFKANKVNRFHGFAEIISPNKIKISKEGNEDVIESKKIIIAAGSVVTPLQGFTFDEEKIISSTGALSLARIPKHLVIIGAGVIGVEFGSVWSRLGSKVTCVEFLDRIGGSNIDAEISQNVQRILTKQGLKFKLKSKVVGAEINGDNITVKVEPRDGGEAQFIDCDTVLVCVGRKPATTGIGLDKLGVKVDNAGRIEVDNAIGDCIRGPMLAHKAEDEGITCVDHIVSGNNVHLNYDAIPSVIYTHPEVAWVGKTESECREMGIKYKVGKFPMMANSRAKTIGETDGFVKVLSDASTGSLIGAHIVNSVAGELINEAVLAIEMKADCGEIARACHAHPTWSESFKEACMAAYYGKSINFG
ncbi:hypothetical protein ACOME3_010016 [Neoechinorhynchus agilis]